MKKEIKIKGGRKRGRGEGERREGTSKKGTKGGKAEGEEWMRSVWIRK